MAPDGSVVVYTLGTTDWDRNKFDTELYVVRGSDEPVELTNAPLGTSTNAKWPPDSERIVYAKKSDNGTPIRIVPASGGESVALTALTGGVMDFAWSPDGKSIAVLIPEPPQSMLRQQAFWNFTQEDVDTFWPHIWLIDVEATLQEADGGIKRRSASLRRLPSGRDFVVGALRGSNFAFSPDGSEIVFSHRVDPYIRSSFEVDVSILDIETGVIWSLVSRPGTDSGAVYSPDGRWILFHTYQPGGDPLA